MRVISGDVIDASERFKVEFVLEYSNTEESGNFWLAPNYQVGVGFILDLGCEDSYDTVELANTHTGRWRDRSTQKFQVFLS